MGEKDWNSVEATYHLKQSERNALDVVALNKLEEIVCVAQLRQRVAELEAERDELVAVLERLSFAAMCRENTAGDPCRLIQVQSELSAANREVIKVITSVKEKP